MMKRHRTLLIDRRGTSTVELGLILPIFATMLVGVVDLSRAFSQKLQMQQGAQRAVEWIQRNKYDPDYNDTIKTEAANGAGTSTSNVTITAWLECNGSKMANWTDSCTATQTMARYVSVNVKKSYTPLFTATYVPTVLSTDAGIRVQ